MDEYRKQVVMYFLQESRDNKCFYTLCSFTSKQKKQAIKDSKEYTKRNINRDYRIIRSSTTWSLCE